MVCIILNYSNEQVMVERRLWMHWRKDWMIWWHCVRSWRTSFKLQWTKNRVGWRWIDAMNTDIEKGPNIPEGFVVLIRFWPENGFGSIHIREMSDSHIIRVSISRGVVPGTVIIRLPNICRESPIQCKPTLISVSSVSLPLRSEQFAISACVGPRDCSLCGG